MPSFPRRLTELLPAQGYAGQINEALSSFLKDASFTGELNEALYAYLDSKNYWGALPEKLYQWELVDFPLTNNTITVVTAPLLNSSLRVGNTLASAYVPGVYTSSSGTVTEDVFTFLVDGVVRNGSYVIAPGDLIVSIPNIPLLINGGFTVYSSYVPDTSVRNTAPVSVGSSQTITVPASGAAPVSFDLVSGQLTRFRDTANWNTTSGKCTIFVDFTTTLTGTQYLYEMDNGHISLQVISDGRVFLSIKDSSNTSLITSLVIGTISSGVRNSIAVAIDLASNNFWTTINGVTTARTVAANTGILSSASRKLTTMARASGTTNNLVGTVYEIAVWEDCVTGGGIPPTDTLLRTNGRIKGGPAVANAHPWKLGGDAV